MFAAELCLLAGLLHCQCLHCPHASTGSSIQSLVVARDVYGNALSCGGAQLESYFVANGCQPVQMRVFDNGNGTYLVSGTLFTAGKFQVCMLLLLQSQLGGLQFLDHCHDELFSAAGCRFAYHTAFQDNCEAGDMLR